jgi:hypothetical protein
MPVTANYWHLMFCEFIKSSVGTGLITIKIEILNPNLTLCVGHEADNYFVNRGLQPHLLYTNILNYKDFSS